MNAFLQLEIILSSNYAITRGWVLTAHGFFRHFEYGRRDPAARRDGTQLTLVCKLAVNLPSRRALRMLKHALP